MNDLKLDSYNLKKTDLHIHTYYSDGQAGPADIVKTAAELGYSLISITDHDGTEGVHEAIDAGKTSGLEVIAGIELASETDNGIGFHILGYGFDIENRRLKETLKKLAEMRRQRNRRLIKVLRDMGYSLSLDDLQRKHKGGFVGKPTIARALEEKGYISDYREAFRPGQFLGSMEARKIKKEKLDIENAISLITGAGGTAVMAHPIQTRHIGTPGSDEFYENIEKIITDMVDMGLKGMECYHPDQDVEQSSRFVEIAKKYGLLITRGSDFHGKDFAEAETTA